MAHTRVTGQHQRKKKKGALEEGLSQEQCVEFDTAVWCEEGGCILQICENETENASSKKDVSSDV